MSSVSFELEYELTREELANVRARAPFGLRRVQRAGFLFAAVIATISAFEESSTFGEWAAVGLLWTCTAMVSSVRWTVWLGAKHQSIAPASFPIHIHVDETGVRQSCPLASKTSPIRYWWERLSEIREDQFGVTLICDRNWTGLCIPWQAFNDAEQRSQFLDLAREHLAGERLRERAVISSEAFQKAS